MRELSTYGISAILTLLLTGFQVSAQTEKSHIRSGNKEYEAGKFDEAEKSYRAAIDENTNSLEGAFNLGGAAYKQENYDDAINQFELLSKKVGTPDQVAQAYHNLGNSYLGKKEYEKGVEAYKQALRNNPKDMDTRYNLAYAQQKLIQQQQEEKKDEEKKDEEKKDDEKKDEEKKDEEKKDEEKKDEEKKDEEKKDKEKKDEEKKNDENKDQKEKSQRPDQLSKEEAQKILEALKNKEMDVQNKLKKQKLKATKVKVDKDW